MNREPIRLAAALGIAAGLILALLLLAWFAELIG